MSTDPLAAVSRDTSALALRSRCPNCDAQVPLSPETLSARGGRCERCCGPFALAPLGPDPFRGGAPRLVGAPPSSAIVELGPGALLLENRGERRISIALLPVSLGAAGATAAAGGWCVASGIARFLDALQPGYGADVLDGLLLAALGVFVLGLAGAMLRRIAWGLDGREALSVEDGVLSRRRSALGIAFTHRLPLSRLRRIAVHDRALAHHLVLRHGRTRAFPVGRNTGQRRETLEWLRHRLERWRKEAARSDGERDRA